MWTQYPKMVFIAIMWTQYPKNGLYSLNVDSIS